MIVAVSVDVQVVARQGSHFQWPTELPCPRCHKKTWGHGKVARIFEVIAALVLVPRRRCPGCKCVITLRPATHKPRTQTAIDKIKSILKYRLIHRVWPTPSRRQRFGHWLRKLFRWWRFNPESPSLLDALCADVDGRFLV